MSGEAAMRVIPLEVGLGAEIMGLDLRDELDAGTLAALLRAAGQFGVLLFRGQGLDEAEQLRFTTALGDADISHLTGAIRASIDEPQARGVHRGALPNTLYWTHGPGYANQGFPERDEGFGRFHSDLSYQQTRLRFTILSAIEAAKRGGETEWVDTAAAYASLDADTRARLRSCEAVHERIEHGSGRRHCAKHPVVVRIPDTSIDALFVNRSFTRSLEGVDEGGALLEQLVARNEETPTRYRHTWADGDLVVWDNFRVLHRRCGFPAGERRVMLRTQARRERPDAALS